MKKWILLALLLGACQNQTLPSNFEAQLQGDDAIVGGTDVPAKDPLESTVLSLVALSNPVQTQKGDAIEISYSASQCTAAALTPRILLTAAHCTSPSATTYRIDVPTQDGKVVRVKGIKAVPHPDYVKDKRADLALILLDVALPEEVHLVKIPAKNADLQLSTIEAAGFGRKFGKKSQPGMAGVLRRTELNVIDYAMGKPIFQTDQTRGTGVCQGDSGGPALLKAQGQTFVVGVVSKSAFFPSADGDHDYCNYRGIYVNTQYFAEDWIMPTVAKLSQE